MSRANHQNYLLRRRRGQHLHHSNVPSSSLFTRASVHSRDGVRRDPDDGLKDYEAPPRPSRARGPPAEPAPSQASRPSASDRVVQIRVSRPADPSARAFAIGRDAAIPASTPRPLPAARHSTPPSPQNPP